MDPVKILNVNYTINPLTGAGSSQRTFDFSQQLIKAGFACDILTLDVGNPPRSLEGGKIIQVPALSKRFPFPFLFLYKINAAVKAADVVHLMSHWVLLNAFTYLAIRLHRKPYAVCPVGSLPVFGRSKFLKIIFNFVIGNRMIRNANARIAVTDGEVTQFEAYGISKDKVVVLPNAIEEPSTPLSSPSDFRKKLNLGDRPFILFLGRLNLIKGPDLLLNAFIEIADEYPGYDLVFAGPDAGMLSELQSIATSSPQGQRIHFIGFIGGSDKFSAYQTAEFLVIPSRHEAMSLVVLEAGIIGTPSLFTTECGLDDFAKQNLGWVAEPSVEALKSQLRLILSNPQTIASMREPLKTFIKSTYSWPIIIKKTGQMFENAIRS